MSRVALVLDCHGEVPGIGSDLALLSQDERKKARRFVFDRDRHQYIRAAALLRRQLGVRCGVAPETIGYERNAYGKLALSSVKPAPCAFNLSHTTRAILIGIAPENLGVDIEFTGGRPFPQEIMSSVFSERECRWMHQDPLGIQIAGFAHWTRKEAVIKADGRGLSLEPATFELMPEPLQPKPTEWRRDRWQCMLAQSAYFGATAALCSGWVYSVACAEEADRDAFVQAFDLLC